MQVLSSYIASKTVQTGFEDNLLKKTQIDYSNLLNWNVEGPVTVVNDEDNNTVTFVNEGQVSAVDAFKASFYQIFGVSLTTEQATIIVNEWSTRSTLPLYVYHYGKDLYYFDLVSNMSETDFNNGDVYCSGGYHAYLNYTKQNAISFIYNQLIRINGVNPHVKLGTYNEYMASINFNGNIDASFTIEENKTYVLKFEFCSPSGFDRGSTAADIVITNGLSIIELVLDNEPQSTPIPYSFVITAAATTLTIDFNLTSIIKADGVELKINNIGLYEIG